MSHAIYTIHARTHTLKKIIFSKKKRGDVSEAPEKEIELDLFSTITNLWQLAEKTTVVTTRHTYGEKEGKTDMGATYA